jgi:hypothetical protein
MRLARPLWLLIVAPLTIAGCLSTRTPAWTTHTSTALLVTPAALANGDLVSRGETEWGQREVEAHARAAVEAWRAALDATPTDSVLWARLARAQYYLADAHVAPDPARSAEAAILFADAASSGERSLLARTPSIGAVLRSGQSFTQILPALDERDVPGLYWRTLALSRWSRANGTFVTQAFRSELRLSMGRVAELDRGYDGAGADRFLGDAWATASTMQGGDLERAIVHFEYAIEAAPGTLANRVLYATDIGPKLQDRALFERQLRAVITSDPGGADVAAENVLEQRRAQAALDRVHQLFP